MHFFPRLSLFVWFFVWRAVYFYWADILQLGKFLAHDSGAKIFLSPSFRMTQISDFWSVKCIYAYMLINPKLKKQNEAAERRMTSHLLNRLDIEPLIIFKFAWSVAETYLSSFKMLGSFSDFTSLVVQVHFSLINSRAVLQYFIFTFFTVCFLFKHFYFNFLHANFRRVSRWKVFVIFFWQHCCLTKFWVRLSKVWHTHLEDWLVSFFFFRFQLGKKRRPVSCVCQFGTPFSLRLTFDN